MDGESAVKATGKATAQLGEEYEKRYRETLDEVNMDLSGKSPRHFTLMNAPPPLFAAPGPSSAARPGNGGARATTDDEESDSENEHDNEERTHS